MLPPHCSITACSRFLILMQTLITSYGMSFQICTRACDKSLGLTGCLTKSLNLWLIIKYKSTYTQKRAKSIRKSRGAYPVMQVMPVVYVKNVRVISKCCNFAGKNHSFSFFLLIKEESSNFMPTNSILQKNF